MLFKILKRCIEKGNYETKEAMEEKLSVLYAADQLTTEQYQELMKMLQYTLIHTYSQHLLSDIKLT